MTRLTEHFNNYYTYLCLRNQTSFILSTKLTVYDNIELPQSLPFKCTVHVKELHIKKSFFIRIETFHFYLTQMDQNKNIQL